MGLELLQRTAPALENVTGAACRGLPRGRTRREQINIDTSLAFSDRFWTPTEIRKQDEMIVASAEQAYDFSTIEKIAAERRLAEANKVIFHAGFALLTHESEPAPTQWSVPWEPGKYFQDSSVPRPRRRLSILGRRTVKS